MNKMIVTIKIRVVAKRRIKRLLIYSLLIRRMIFNNCLLVILIRLIFLANTFVKSKSAVCI